MIQQNNIQVTDTILSINREHVFTLLGAACSLCQPAACSHDTNAVVVSLLQTLGMVLYHQTDRSTPPVQYEMVFCTTHATVNNTTVSALAPTLNSAVIFTIINVKNLAV